VVYHGEAADAEMHWIPRAVAAAPKVEYAVMEDKIEFAGVSWMDY